MATLTPAVRRWLLRATVSIVFAVVLLRIVPFHTVLEALERISIWAWMAALGVFVAGHYLNALKLRLLLGAELISSSMCIRAQYAGLVANLGLPGIAGGDLVRAAYLTPSVGPRRVVLASVADRLVDTLTLLVLVAVALPLAGAPPVVARIVHAGSRWFLAVAMAAALLIAAAWRLRTHPAVAGKLMPLWTGLRNRRRAVAGAAVISVMVQAAFVLTNVWLARNVGVTTGLAPWFVAWPLSKLVAVLPISLGGIGVREAALVSLLAPYGAPRDGVLASGILWQAVLTVSGLAGLLVTHGWAAIPGRQR